LTRVSHRRVWWFFAWVALLSIVAAVIGHMLVGKMAYVLVGACAALAVVARFDTERGICLPVAVLLMIVVGVLALLLALLALRQ
jgi:hypothetical protein